MISSEQFLALLEKKEFLSAGTAASFLAQIAKSPNPVPVTALARQLVEQGQITLSQAQHLLAAAEKAPPPKTEEELGFAPLEDEPAVKSPAAKPAAKPPTEKTVAKPPAAARTGSLLDEEMTSPAEAGGPLTLGGYRRGGFRRFFVRKPKFHKDSRQEQWGSSLMLVGGGGLLFLLILCGFLLYALNRGRAEEMLKLADDDYRAGSYSQAINKYNIYLGKFPRTFGAGLARVRIGLARLRQATQSGSNWPTALRTAGEVLEKIAVETDFKEAHAELSAMLPAIAEGLAADARKKPNQASVDQVRRALAMVEKYVPRRLRPTSKLTDVEASLALTVRQIARGDELDKTIAAMRRAAKELNTDAAYAACAALLRQYPDLAGNTALEQSLLAVSESQQTLVKTISEQKPAEAGEVASAALRTFTLVQRDTKTRAPGLEEGQVALAAVDGAVYGLDAATGKVFWRRFVGFDANPLSPSLPPTPLSSSPDSDVLVVDTGRNELLRLEGATGRVRWRCAVGEPFDAHPVIAGEKIFVATRSGKLITIAATSGDSPGYVQFPQPLGVAPAIDGRRSLIYQVAVRANLFILSLDNGACRRVEYLGHDPGSIVTPPVIVDDYLLVSINDGARDADLWVLAIQSRPKNSDKPEPWLKPVQRIRLGGHVQTPPPVEGRRVLVTTGAGVVRVFELSAAEVETPLVEVAETAIEGGNNIVRFSLMRRGRFWIADSRLTKYDVLAARGRLMPKWIIDEDSAFLQPPTAFGQTIVTVRRKLGMPGAFVSAVAMQEPNKLWETQLAMPPAGEPLVLAEEDKIIAVAASGGVFRIDAGGSGPAIVDQPITAPDAFRLRRPVNHVVRLDGGLLAISDGRGGDQIGVFDPRRPSPLIYWLKLPERLACQPTAFGRGLLAPSRAGPVFLLDPWTGRPLAEPFQPRLAPGDELDWITPTIIGDNEAVLTDGKMNIYRIGLRDQPKPHLAALAEIAVVKPINAPLAVAGETVYACDVGGVLTAFALPALSRGKQRVLDGRCVWGPVGVGDAVLLATDDDQLLCMDAKGDRLWQTGLKYGPPVGAPLRLDGHYLFASRSGTIWRVEAATGKESGKIDLHRPLATGPVLLGRRLLVGGHDGTLYEVRQP